MAAGNGLPVARSMDEVDRQLSELAAPLHALREQEEARLNDIALQKEGALAALEEQRQAVLADARQQTAVSRDRVKRITRTLETLQPTEDREPNGRPRRASSARPNGLANPDEEVLGQVRDFLNTVQETTGPDVDAALGLKKGRGHVYLETLRGRGEARKSGKKWSEQQVNNGRGQQGRKCAAYRPMREVSLSEAESREAVTV